MCVCIIIIIHVCTLYMYVHMCECVHVSNCDVHICTYIQGGVHKICIVSCSEDKVWSVRIFSDVRK